MVLVSSNVWFSVSMIYIVKKTLTLLELLVAKHFVWSR